MKAGSGIKILTCGVLCLAAAPASSQQIRIQAALPADSHIDNGKLADSLPVETEVYVRRIFEAPAIVEQVRLRKIDIAIVPTTSVTNVAPAFAAFDLPFIFIEDFPNLSPEAYPLPPWILVQYSEACSCPISALGQRQL